MIKVYIKYLKSCLLRLDVTIFMTPRSKSGVILFLSCLSFCYFVILLFCPPLRNFNLAYNFWTVSARALLFHMSILSVSTIIFDPVTLTLKFDQLKIENFNLANNFWSMSARALIFHLSIPCGKTFPLVPLCFTLWPWPESLTPTF